MLYHVGVQLQIILKEYFAFLVKTLCIYGAIALPGAPEDR